MNHSPKSSTYYQYDSRLTTYSNATMSASEHPSYYNEMQMDDGKWTRDQTQILIDTWKEHKGTLLNNAASSAEHFKIWKVIANEVNKLSPPKSLQQCKKKFRNIRYICKTAISNNKQNGTKKHYPMFYSDFMEIIAETERLKERGDLSMDALRDGSVDSVDYSNVEVDPSSPPNHESQNGVIIKNDEVQNKSKPKVLSKTKNVPSFNSTDGSYHDSPHSHESEARSHESEHTPSYHGVEGGSPGDRHDIEEGALNGKEQSIDDTYPEENRNFSTTPDLPGRKHKTNDVSIMGRGYPPLKRIKKTEVIHPAKGPYTSPSNQPTPLITLSGESYPTMATVPQNVETYSVSNGNYVSPSVTSAAKKYSSGHREMHYLSTKQASTSLDEMSSSHPMPSKPSISRDNSLRSRYSMDGGSFNVSFNDRFLDVQERQMELFSDMLNRHEQFLLRLLSQQREAAEEAQKRDREFMLKLIEMFVKNNNN